jgi:hypothetical protein
MFRGLAQPGTCCCPVEEANRGSNRAVTLQLLPYMFYIPGVVDDIEFCDTEIESIYKVGVEDTVI